MMTGFREPASPAAVLDHVRMTLEMCPDFGFDDALWCIEYEPASKKVRAAIGAACGAVGKDGLIDWDLTHTPAERMAVLDQVVLGP